MIILILVILAGVFVVYTLNSVDRGVHGAADALDRAVDRKMRGEGIINKPAAAQAVVTLVVALAMVAGLLWWLSR